MSGTVYIKKDGKVAFQGLNNGKCQVKRYSETEPEVFTNNNSICSKPIYKNLVKNGYGEYGNNTNFSNFTYNTATNDFKINVSKLTQVSTDYYIPIDSSKKYNYSMEAYTQLSNEENYIGLELNDIDKLVIDNHFTSFVSNTLTTLAKDLNNGDTVIYLDSTLNWDLSYNSYSRSGLIFWNYSDSNGYHYPELTYSRNVFSPISPFLYNLSNVNKNNNTIILNNAWTYGTIKKGTKLSQSSDNGGTYKYPLVFGQSLSNTSKKYSSIISNIGSNENNFRYATKYVRVVLLLNYSSTFSSIDTQYTFVKNIIFEEID